MKKILYFAVVFLIILPSVSFTQDEQDAFTSASPDYSSINASSIFADTTPVPSGDQNPNAPTGDNYLNAMSENTSGVQQQQQDSGISVSSPESQTQAAVSTANDKQQEYMMQSNEVNIQEQAKTREEIDKDIADLFAEGKKYYNIEDYDGAAQIWERIIINYPTAKKLFDIRYALANAYEYSRQYDKALVQYQKVLAEKPKDPIAIEASYRLAGCYGKLEKWNYAIEIYKDMISRNPTKSEVVRSYFSLAVIYMKQENFKRVETIYKNIIKYFPNSQWEIQARFQLASLYGQTNRFKSAIKEYKLIKFKFRDTEWAPRAAMHIGDTYKLAGDYKAAKEAYSRVMYEFYNNDVYTQQADERIKSLKNQKEIENRFYEQ